MKAIGNDLFKKGDCTKALRKYKKATKYLQHVEEPESEKEDETPSAIDTELRKIVISLYLNRYYYSFIKFNIGSINML